MNKCRVFAPILERSIGLYCTQGVVPLSCAICSQKDQLKTVRKA